MKRRVISLLLTLVLAMGLAGPAWGADAAPEDLRLSVEQALTAAQKLHAMGLFQGVGDNADGTPNFDLDRTPTRVEGVVMLVRLLGEDQEGAGGGWESPFADVPAWAASYVGYAYGRGYTKGTSDTAFSPMDPLDAAQYLTLVLRAMGYEDGADFQWDSPWTLSNQLGITDYDPSSPDAFTRGTAAVWAWNAMSAQTSAGVRLADRLMAGGALTAEQAAAVGLAGGDALSVELVGPDLPANFTGYNSSGYLAYDITINSLSCRYTRAPDQTLEFTDCDFTINYLAPGAREILLRFTVTDQNGAVVKGNNYLLFRTQNGTPSWTYSTDVVLSRGGIYTVTLSN
ncbi:S-layer homology domain-containing protein [Pseudoflavonifractor sp. CLA-AP-H29]|uniref:S-layer homology domain-containing protein n=1 Tax=Pseudoflavonifractor intestinihominis TaxID=3133171 RepID=A0ABV1E995_9FIRM